MSRKIKSDVKKSLNILGLNFDSSREQIILRTKKLSSVYEDSNLPGDIEKLAEIYNASQTLLANLDLLIAREEFYGPNHDDFVPDLKDEKSIAQFNDYKNDERVSDSFSDNLLTKSSNSDKPMKKRRAYKLIGFIAAIIMVFLAISIPLGINYSRENRYRSIETRILNVQSIFDLRVIGREIDRLPYNYRDIRNIKEQQQMILREFTIIQNGNISTDSERMRNAYYSLQSIDDNLFNWDLSGYLSRVDSRILLYDVSWVTGGNFVFGQTYYFRLYPNPENPSRLLLSTNLPSNKQSGVDYYFTVNSNYTIFGYENQNDVNDKFDAFRILSIKKDEIRIYCYVDQQTYLLSSDDS